MTLYSLQTGDPYDPGYTPGDDDLVTSGSSGILPWVILGVIVVVLVYGAVRSKKRGEW